MWSKHHNAPIPGRETTAVIEIHLARTADFQLAHLKIQPSTLQIFHHGTSKTAEPRVMQALVALGASAGRVISRDELIERCWAGRAVSEDAINRCIAKVRQLGGEANAFVIETIPRVGYRLIENRSITSARYPHRFRVRILEIIAFAVAMLAMAIGSRFGVIEHRAHAATSFATLVCRAHQTSVHGVSECVCAALRPRIQVSDDGLQILADPILPRIEKSAFSLRSVGILSF